MKKDKFRSDISDMKRKFDQNKISLFCHKILIKKSLTLSISRDLFPPFRVFAFLTARFFTCFGVLFARFSLFSSFIALFRAFKKGFH